MLSAGIICMGEDSDVPDMVPFCGVDSVDGEGLGLCASMLKVAGPGAEFSELLFGEREGKPSFPGTVPEHVEDVGERVTLLEEAAPALPAEGEPCTVLNDLSRG